VIVPVRDPPTQIARSADVADRGAQLRRGVPRFILGHLGHPSHRWSRGAGDHRADRRLQAIAERISLYNLEICFQRGFLGKAPINNAT
jgi:hypothetical protein